MIITVPDSFSSSKNSNMHKLLKEKAEQWGLDLSSEEFAKKMDKDDMLSGLRDEFHIPKGNNSKEVTYLLGNSLGLQPKSTKQLVNEELQVWAEQANEGHFKHQFGRPWVTVDEECANLLLPLTGAIQGEIAVMGSLTANLHLLMCSFYHPTDTRYKIVLESKAFPSDHYLIESQLRLHGIDPKEGMLMLEPRDNEHALRIDDILEILEDNKDSIAIVLLPGVQYYTGQLLDMAKITKKSHEIGAIMGLDLAHAIGNAPLKLHDWDVDFAAWCCYKYLNAGPGAIAGLFVHTKHDNNCQLTPLRGWWGHEKATRFVMDNTFKGILGAKGFQLSNPSAISMTCLLASLLIFSKTDIHSIHSKSTLMNSYLRHLLQPLCNGPNPLISFITPEDPTASGAQLSILVSNGKVGEIVEKCKTENVVFDKREPGLLRIAPVSLYNTFTDVYNAASILTNVIKQTFTN